jgi:galactokinase/galacturonokinase
MQFPDLIQEKEKLVATFSRENNVPLRDIRVIASPYRVSPLGAHIDHQGGPVLGMTINAYSLLAYVPAADARLTLRSENYPGQVKINLHQLPANSGSFWGSYARAAALALNEDGRLERGVNGLINGMLPGCGLSSSASVLLAYLFALAEANGLRPQPWDFVRLTQRAENKYIGLNNGILDQTSIVFGKRHHLLHIDTIERSVQTIENKLQEKTYRILIAYSGFSRELMTTGYNTRVQECREAATELARLDGTPPAARLADVSEQTFQQHGRRLADHLQRRAAHFFSEVGRVQRGLKAWQEGRLEYFGRLMVESCQSSIEQYECGSPAIHDLQQIVSSAAGVIGSRFGGGGFGGCVVGLVATDRAVDAVRDIRDAYLKCHPEAAGRAAVYLATSADGVRFL